MLDALGVQAAAACRTCSSGRRRAIVLPTLLPRAWARSVGRWAITIGFRLYVGALALTRAYRFDLSALDALRGEPPMIIAPNHPSLIDAVLVLSRLPVDLHHEGGTDEATSFSARARALRATSATTRCIGMIDRSIASLRQGTHLLVFPEGTRTTRSPVNPFTGSIGIIARHARVPVQTVFIDTDSPYLSKGWPLFRKPTLPITYRIRLGKRFDPPERARESRQGTRAVLCTGARARLDDAVLATGARGAMAAAGADPRSVSRPRWPAPRRTHLILIPSYNPGPRVSRDGARRAPILEPGLGGRRWQHRRHRRGAATNGRAGSGPVDHRSPRNTGKGAAVLHGLDLAAQRGFTHALTMDSDGQHPAELIPEFMAAFDARSRTA